MLWKGACESGSIEVKGQERRQEARRAGAFLPVPGCPFHGTPQPLHHPADAPWVLLAWGGPLWALAPPLLGSRWGEAFESWCRPTTLSTRPLTPPTPTRWLERHHRTSSPPTADPWHTLISGVGVPGCAG
jgi:hypothetical protein